MPTEETVPRKPTFNAGDWGAVILSGGLMAASFVPWNHSALAWVAWTPLLSRLFPVRSSESCSAPFRLGFGAGFIFWLLTVYWLMHVTILGMVALAAYLALYTGAWTLGLAMARRRWGAICGMNHLLLASFGAAWGVALDWVRGWMLGGFPWNFAGVSQHQNLALIQMAEWTGVYGISFVLLFFNAALWLTWRRLRAERFSPRSWRYEFSIALFLIALCLFGGMRSLLNAGKAEKSGLFSASTFKVALIQPNVPQEIKYEALSREDQRQRLEKLSRAAAAVSPDLILWPETAVVDGPSFHPENRFWLERLARELNIPILLGTLDAVHENEGGKKDKVRYYNAAVFVGNNGAWSAHYHKLHLVPFGEFIPWERWMPWLGWLTPIASSFEKGDRPVLFDFRGIRLGPLICFEDIFPDLARNMSNEGARVLLNLTNDAWFRDSPAAAMHAANAVFRAIETRRPLVRCANHGLTLIVEPTGRVLSHLKPFTDGFLIATVVSRDNPPQTVFARYGDWFPIGCALVSAACLGAARILPRRRGKDGVEGSHGLI